MVKVVVSVKSLSPGQRRTPEVRPGPPRLFAGHCGTICGMGLFTVPEAREILAELRPVLDELVALRADAAELAASLRPGGAPTPLGGLPEWKAAQARLDELMSTVQGTGAELKGFAPLLIDFPAALDDVPVLLCWLEGDDGLDWYHRVDLGFAGRRPLESPSE